MGLKKDYNMAEMAKRLPQKQTNLHESWRMFKANKPALVSMFVVILLFVVAFIGPLVWTMEDAVRQVMTDRLLPPGQEYWFGTDGLGRDNFARVINGARVSLTMGFVPTIVSLFFGMLFGGIAAYFGKWVDNVIMRICDLIQCIPGLLLMIMISFVFGSGLTNVLIAITFVSIPGMIRGVRALILHIVENDYIEAARACGTSEMMIMYKHVLKNAVGPLVLAGVSGISGMIMAGAGLSFLGLGIQPPYPEWGFMLATSREFLFRAPYLMWIPGFAILISILSFNLVGDGLRDVLDPKLRR